MDINIENARKSFQTLGYIVESKSKFINEVNVSNVSYNEDYGQYQCYFYIKTISEDPDIGSFKSDIDMCDTELYDIIKEYTFRTNGTIKKTQQGDLMMLFIGCEWNLGRGSVCTLKYQLVQDEFDE